MKVSIKNNQVEVALQALLCSVEKVLFGSASLKDKKKCFIFCLVESYLVQGGGL